MHHCLGASTAQLQGTPDVAAHPARSHEKVWLGTGAAWHMCSSVVVCAWQLMPHSSVSVALTVQTTKVHT